MSEEIFYDVIIVGGGPGGSTAASFLAKKGRKVLLLDKEKWPRDKTCGDAISGKSLKVLKELGLIETLEKADHAIITGITFSSPNGKQVSIPFRKNDQGIAKGYVCRRLVYDNLLWNNAKHSGAHTHEGANVLSVIRENGKIVGVKAKMHDGTDAEFRGKIIIGADGVSSLIAREVRGPEVDPDHTCLAYRAYYSGVTGMNDTIEIHFVKSCMPGYFWIFPLENGLANVGIGMIMADVRKKDAKLDKAMLDAIATNPLFKERFANAKMVSPLKAWSLPFGSKKRKVHADNVMLIGDSAGLVDPFSGEGIGNAMTSGFIASKVADEALTANDTSEKFLAVYEERLWKEIWNELNTSYTMQKLGHYEWLLDLVVNKAATSDKAREAIAGTFSNTVAKQGYQSPLFYLKLLLS
ncbi:MAG: geranylgeranyl reductase family protein [Candidatus Micrarchaeota archaeon]|nr:geranylgeranyl reductase family protein [Candidatus Micrarchaeota archaeon]